MLKWFYQVLFISANVVVIMKDGFIRVAAATPGLRPADPAYNAKQIFELVLAAQKEDVSLLALPELCLTGASCADLFLSSALLVAAKQALVWLIEATATSDMIIIAGLPFSYQSRLYNVAAVWQSGRLLGLVPKTGSRTGCPLDLFRYFSCGSDLAAGSSCQFLGQTVPLGSNLLFCQQEDNSFTFQVQLGLEQEPELRPDAALLVRLTADNEQPGRLEKRLLLCSAESLKHGCSLVLANAGPGESTTDLVFAGRNFILEKGRLLAQAAAFDQGLLFSEIDLQLLQQEKMRKQSKNNSIFPTISFCQAQKELDLTRQYAPAPFVPADPAGLAERCELILQLQAQGLRKRLAHTGSKHVVLGLSGGLDSTLAFLVILRAFDLLQLDKKGIVAVIMPGFGTTSRTRQNAWSLAISQAVTIREISISQAVEQHFADIGHDPSLHDITYENAQARERTQILMDLANQYGGLVIGTGDLSELALGWCTYNADHMSMYAVNSSVPKTLIRPLIRHEAASSKAAIKDLLEDIMATPVSPELLPAEAGKIQQKTEDLVGPYDLHDFFLFYTIRHGFGPAKILRLASLAFAAEYDTATIKKWLQVFIRRFFAQQFKRSCLPDGPVLGSVGLSPRSSWHMPSDAVPSAWLSQLD